MASLSSYAFQVKSSIQRTDTISHNFNNFKTTLVSSFKPFLKNLGRIPVQVDEIPRMLKNTSIELLNAFVDSTFEFVEQPILPSQSNFAPVEEIGNPIVVNNVEGRIPADFPEGIYARNGSNPLFGGLQSSHSIFGRSNHIWVEGEGMIHAIYFNKESDGSWRISYNNRYVETETFKFEKPRKKPSFIPAVEGNPPAILSASLLNMLRFGRVNKVYSNTNIFEHAGKFYSISEADLPQEIDLLTLETLGPWDVNGAWSRPFFSHPKKAPGTGELVTMGVDAKKPFHELGVISADGELVHKVDLKFKRCTLCHDLGVTQRYNVILDFPLVLDINRVINGGPFMKYDETDYARIGVLPRYGDSDSIKWFDVKASSAFHVFNCFEDGDEVVMWACRARGSVLPGPDLGIEKFEHFYRGFKHVKSIKQNTNSKLPEGLFFTRAYEWRLNMQTGEVKERHLTGTNYSMDFPMINDKFVGLKNKFGYTQVVDSEESSNASIAKYGGLAKLHFEELSQENAEELIKVEYHIFPKNTFCTGSAFVSKIGGLEEDDGFIVTFVHNEDSNISQVYVIDTKKFSDEPVTIITLPNRVPYGFHGVFMSITPRLQQLPGNA